MTIKELLIDLIPTLKDLGDGCEMCVGDTIKEINKVLEKYGYRYKYTCKWKNQEDFDFDNYLELEELGHMINWKGGQ